MSRPPLEVADIIRSRKESFEQQSRGWINWQHRKVLDAIVRCRQPPSRSTAAHLLRAAAWICGSRLIGNTRTSLEFMALSDVRRNDARHRPPLGRRSSPTLSASAHDVCHMIMHQGHRCHHLQLSQQEIPASDHWSSCETTNLSDCSEPQVDLPRSIHLIEKASNPHAIHLKCSRPHSNYISIRRPAGFHQVAVSKAPLHHCESTHQCVARALQIQPKD